MFSFSTLGKRLNEGKYEKSGKMEIIFWCLFYSAFKKLTP
jgi:hypothetical protein